MQICQFKIAKKETKPNKTCTIIAYDSFYECIETNLDMFPVDNSTNTKHVAAIGGSRSSKLSRTPPASTPL